jgi:hypothetical protein
VLDCSEPRGAKASTRQYTGATAQRKRDSAEVMSPGERLHMTTILPRESRFPSLAGATEWRNSEPLTPADLRGRVVLIDFGDHGGTQLSAGPEQVVGLPSPIQTARAGGRPYTARTSIHHAAPHGGGGNP